MPETSRTAACFVALMLCCGMAAAGLVQEGHPLTGTWTGDWAPAPSAQRNHLTVVLAWDGQNVTGTINPGPDSVAIGSFHVDVTNWTIRFDADTKDASGGAVHIAAEGRLADLGSYRRTIAGTWTQGTAKGEFKLTRN